MDVFYLISTFIWTSVWQTGRIFTVCVCKMTFATKWFLATEQKECSDLFGPLDPGLGATAGGGAGEGHGVPLVQAQHRRGGGGTVLTGLVVCRVVGSDNFIISSFHHFLSFHHYIISSFHDFMIS